jgi:protein gp37
MNKQGKKINGQWAGGIEWTRVRGRPGFTWNVVQGCKHDCKWRMPDGTLAECYAKTTAEKFKSDTFFPDGFEHHYFNGERLDEPLQHKEPTGIFLDSVADLMGHWVPAEQILQVLDVCRKAHWHIFQLLTKNAPRLINFDIPPNVWPGVSAPPTFMFGKELTPEQQRAMVMKQLDVLSKLKTPVRWMSIEPLSFDITEVFEEWVALPDRKPFPMEWAVIGAASNGPKYFQPDRRHVEKLHFFLRAHGCMIFHKGNLEWNPHLEEFPI